MKNSIIAALLIFMAVPAVLAQTVIGFALPTPAEHLRNQAVLLWAERVAAESGGKLTIDVRHGVTGYDGSRVPVAVAEGAYDMAAPGWWNLSRYAPDFALSSLPMFYGRERGLIQTFFDGETGAELDRSLEQALNVKVIGRRLDLGFGQIYLAAKAVRAYEDLKALNIRVPGGGADLARYLVFGATPRRIALRDLEDALRRKLIGGLLTTPAFVADAALWKAGIRYAFLDNQVFYQYTPIINRVRWEALAPEERDLLTRSWAATVDGSRRIVAARQARARAQLERNNVAFVEAPADARAAMRAKLMKEQPAIVAALEINPKLATRAQAVLAKLRKTRQNK